MTVGGRLGAGLNDSILVQMQKSMGNLPELSVKYV